ncbi:EamA family transporter [Nostoc paludosum]|uniref:EamA family transporter n=1 Tax=Nostoc paludosum TaxID=212362 RepID=UPI0018EFF126|nr:EamA family transporter [Nostoc paludosum]
MGFTWSWLCDRFWDRLCHLVSCITHLQATQAATVQLSVPILAAVGAILFLNEPMTVRLGIATVAALSGIALVIKQQTERI